MKVQNRSLISAAAVFSTAVLLAFVFVPNAPSPTSAQPPTTEYDPTEGTQVEAQGSPRSPLDDQRVFVFGDSQVAGAPGRALGHHMIAAGATYYARAGQSGWGVINWWNVRGQINRLLQRHNPTLVIIILGGNDWERVQRENYPTRVQNLWRYVNERAEAAKPEGSRLSVCWMGPARVVGEREAEVQPGRDRVARIVRETVGAEHFVRSNDITGRRGRGRDGIHFTARGASDWMRQATPRIAECVRQQHPNTR